MINFLFHILISLSYLFNPIERTSWIYESNGINEVRIYSENYFVVSNYNINNKKFIILTFLILSKINILIYFFNLV